MEEEKSDFILKEQIFDEEWYRLGILRNIQGFIGQDIIGYLKVWE